MNSNLSPLQVKDECLRAIESPVRWVFGDPSEAAPAAEEIIQRPMGFGRFDSALFFHMTSLVTPGAYGMQIWTSFD